MSRQLVYIQNKVNNAAIRRIRNERGDLVYVVPSYTLPDDVVMNGGLYPAEEIERSYMTLEDTPAPAGHPYNANGEYISASSPEGVLYFQCGIFNKNVQRMECQNYGHRVYVEKHIHVETAMKSERGKRIIDAIDKGQPIHTSTGILLNSVDEIGTNARGQEYKWRATNMMFDHDAILLDEEGAATPADGVGMMVNAHLFKTVRRDSQLVHVNTATPDVNQSFNDLREVLQTKLQKRFGDDDNRPWLVDFDEKKITFELQESYYQVMYMKDDDGNVALDEDATEVKRITAWEPVSAAPAKRFTSPFNNGKTTTNEGKDMFKEHIEKQLKANKVDTSGMDDAQLMEAYESMLKANAAKESQPKGEQGQPGDVVVNDAVQQLIDQSIAKALAANKAAEEAGIRKDLGEKLKTNGVELDESDLKTMSVSALQRLVDKTTPAGATYLSGGQLTNNSQSRFGDDLPE